EFYAKMKVTHLRKKDVIKSSVKGIDIEFDHERLATILGVHSGNGIREYIEEVWEESKYTKPLEITRRVANDETITVAGREVVRTRRRDDAQEEEEEEEEERNKDDFDREAVIDEATVEGESGSDDRFYDARVEVEEPSDETQATPAVQTSSSTRRKIENLRSRPLGSYLRER
ncbi:hypothetical protein Dimus_024301, partial [Dionaea muscipula]